MKDRIAIVLSASALVVALLGVTGLGGAAGNALQAGVEKATNASAAGPTVTGPRGPRGPRGLRGFRGARGLAGARGIQGVAGPQGAQGVQGPPGPQGLKGDKGDAGGDGFENAICSTLVVNCTDAAPVISQSSSTAASPFLTRALPAGSYIITGQAIVQATDLGNPSDWLVQCNVRVPVNASPAFVGFGWATVGSAGPAVSGDATTATITVVVGATLSGADTAGMRCWRGAGGGASGTGANPVVVYATIDAVQVRSLSFG